MNTKNWDRSEHMGSKLKQIIYTSEPIDNITYQQIETINRSSRKYNKQYDITGLLLYTGKKFIQILEGIEQDLERLFSEKITNCELHHSIEIISESKIHQKNFSTWSMNYFVLEAAFFESDPCLKRKYLKHFKQNTLYSSKFLVFSLLYDIHACILEESGNH